MSALGGRELVRLENLRDRFDARAARAKLACLHKLDRTRLATAGQVLRLHEALCFLRAYPDDPAVLARGEAMLARFERRADLRHHANALDSSGIAGTAIRYRFFAPMARWLAHCWPRSLHLARADPAAAGRIAALLPLAVTPAEAIWLRAHELEGFAAIDALRPSAVTDATFLVRAIATLPGDSFSREQASDHLDAEYVLTPGRDTPSRTRAKLGGLRIVFQSQPLDHTRPSLAEALRQAPARIERLSPGAGERAVD
ncbi:MAG: hypothetical protein ABIU95_05535, partial [Burkholderiales bacterium]